MGKLEKAGNYKLKTENNPLEIKSKLEAETRVGMKGYNLVSERTLKLRKVGRIGIGERAGKFF